MINNINTIPFLSAALSCINPLNGAKPVPGPTITTGFIGRYGNRSDERRI